MVRHTVEDEIDFRLDEDAEELLDRVLCGIFNGSERLARHVTYYLCNCLKIGMLSGPHKVLFSIIYKEFKSGDVILHRDFYDEGLLIAHLQKGLIGCIKQYSKSFEVWIRNKGLDFSFDSNKSMVEAQDMLYSETIQKYREIMKYNPEQVEEYIDSFSRNLMTTAFSKALYKSSEIATTGSYFLGEFVQGPLEGMIATERMLNYIESRFQYNTSKSRRYEIKKIRSSSDVEETEVEFFSRIGGKSNLYGKMYDCGLEMIGYVILRGTISIMGADEGTGKTRWLVDQVFRAMKAGLHCYLICTETLVPVYLNMIKTRLLYEEKHIRMDFKEFLKLPEFIETLEEGSENRKRAEEDYAEMLKICDDFFDGKLYPGSGRLNIQQNCKTVDIKKHAEHFFSHEEGDIAFIDSLAMLDREYKDKGEAKKALDSLMEDLEAVKVDHNATFVITTHSSSVASQQVARGKEVSGVRVTSDTSTTSKAANNVGFMYSTDSLKELDRVIVQSSKQRDTKRSIKKVILQRIGECCCYYYDESIQELPIGTESTDDELLNNL